MGSTDFKTFNDQIKTLETRGLSFQNIDFAKEKLASENYYNIINGYKSLFLDNSHGTEKFIEGSTFEEVYALYSFDRIIRSVIFTPIMKIENTLRTQIAYVFSKYHNSSNYMQYANFENFVGIGYNDATISRRASDIYNLISTFQSEISKSINKRDYISHQIIDHGFVPLWVLVNAISLGKLSKFYKLMNQSERIEISQYWNINESELKEYINTLAYYRNLCAHDERLFCSKCKTDIANHTLHTALCDIDINGKVINGKNDLFSLIIIFKILLSSDDFNSLFNKINGRILSLEKGLHSIDISRVLTSMGFPANWKSIKSI